MRINFKRVNLSVKNQFSKYAKEYKNHNIIQQIVAKSLVRELKFQPKRILELGCGSGQVFNHISWEVEFYKAIDASASMCELHPKSENIEVKCLNFDTQDFINEIKNDSYDIVLSSSALQWSNDLSKIEKQVKVLETSKDSEFCFTQALEFDSNTSEKIKIFPKKPLSGDVLNSVFLRQHVPAGSIMFSKNLFDKLSGFDESLKEEDWDFVIRSAANTKFMGIKEPLFFYRSHESNVMKTRGRKEIFKQKILLLIKNFNLV